VQDFNVLVVLILLLVLELVLEVVVIFRELDDLELDELDELDEVLLAEELLFLVHDAVTVDTDDTPERVLKAVEVDTIVVL
jgi:hypothetical protein